MKYLISARTVRSGWASLKKWTSMLIIVERRITHSISSSHVIINSHISRCRIVWIKVELVIAGYLGIKAIAVQLKTWMNSCWLRVIDSRTSFVRTMIASIARSRIASRSDCRTLGTRTRKWIEIWMEMGLS